MRRARKAGFGCVFAITLTSGKRVSHAARKSQSQAGLEIQRAWLWWAAGGGIQPVVCEVAWDKCFDCNKYCNKYRLESDMHYQLP